MDCVINEDKEDIISDLPNSLKTKEEKVLDFNDLNEFDNQDKRFNDMRYTFNSKIKLFLLFSFLTMIIVGTEFLYRDELFKWSIEKIVSLHKRYSNTDHILYNLSYLISWLPRFQVTFVITLLIYNYSYPSKVISVLSATYFGQCFNSLLKLIYHNPRPQWMNDEILSFKCDPAYGNPSGHSMETTSLFLTLWDVSINHNNLLEGNFLPFKYIILSLVIVSIILISLSRLVLGVHTLNQIIYGNLLGLIVFFFIKYMMFENDYNSDSFFRRYFEDLSNITSNEEINSRIYYLKSTKNIKLDKTLEINKVENQSHSTDKNKFNAKYNDHNDLKDINKNSEFIYSIKDNNKDNNHSKNENIMTIEDKVYEKKELSFKDFKMRFIIIMIISLIMISALAFYFFYKDSEQEKLYNSIIDKRCGVEYSSYKRLSNKQLEVCLNVSAFLFIILGIEIEVFLMHDKNLNSFYRNTYIWNDTKWWISIIRFLLTGGIVVGIYYGISSIIPETKTEYTGDSQNYNRNEIESNLASLIIIKGPLPQILIMLYVFFINKYLCSKINLINI